MPGKAPENIFDIAKSAVRALARQEKWKYTDASRAADVLVTVNDDYYGEETPEKNIAAEEETFERLNEQFSGEEFNLGYRAVRIPQHYKKHADLLEDILGYAFNSTHKNNPKDRAYSDCRILEEGGILKLFTQNREVDFKAVLRKLDVYKTESLKKLQEVEIDGMPCIALQQDESEIYSVARRLLLSPPSKIALRSADGSIRPWTLDECGHDTQPQLVDCWEKNKFLATLSNIGIRYDNGRAA